MKLLLLFTTLSCFCLVQAHANSAPNTNGATVHATPADEDDNNDDDQLIGSTALQTQILLTGSSPSQAGQDKPKQPAPGNKNSTKHTDPQQQQPQPS